MNLSRVNRQFKGNFRNNFQQLLNSQRVIKVLISVIILAIVAHVISYSYIISTFGSNFITDPAELERSEVGIIMDDEHTAKSLEAAMGLYEDNKVEKFIFTGNSDSLEVLTDELIRQSIAVDQKNVGQICRELLLSGTHEVILIGGEDQQYFNLYRCAAAGVEPIGYLTGVDEGLANKLQLFLQGPYLIWQLNFSN